MRYAMPRSEFKEAYGLSGAPAYECFLAKLNSELVRELDEVTAIHSLKFHASWRDAGGNRHASLLGQTTRFHQSGDLRGQLVWLRKAKVFRGWLKNSLEPHTDRQLALMARESFRTGNFRAARQYLQAVREWDSMPASMEKLTYLIEKRFEQIDGEGLGIAGALPSPSS
jgi:hypothetical protein